AANRSLSKNRATPQRPLLRTLRASVGTLPPLRRPEIQLLVPPSCRLLEALASLTRLTRRNQHMIRSFAALSVSAPGNCAVSASTNRNLVTGRANAPAAEETQQPGVLLRPAACAVPEIPTAQQ